MMFDHIHYPITPPGVEVTRENDRRFLLFENVDDLAGLPETLLFGPVEVHARHDDLPCLSGQPDPSRERAPRFFARWKHMVHDLDDGPP